MIKVSDKQQCCGCNACGDICPKGSITFKTDVEGFWYPEVDMDTCVDCHLCEKVCPVSNIKGLKKNNLPQSECYAAEHKNLEVVFDSTSGGLFSALADVIYKDKGFVGGAVFNDDFSVRQYISNDKKDLERLRSSKYLQSNLEGFYKQVQELVKSNEMVLVCGTPCQMAALRAYLKKDYANLIIADFICRGINSPKVWRKYLDSFEERYNSTVVYAKAKSKEYGWRNLTQKVILANGKHVYETRDESNYTKGYLFTGVYCRPSCYDCKFKGYPRIADITLADFWGIENIDKSMEKDLGTSLVMVNSQKGKVFFERTKKRINCIPVPFDSIEAGNRSLNLSVEPPKVDRKQFFEDLDRMTFLQIAEKYINPQNQTSLSVPNKVSTIKKLWNVVYRQLWRIKHPIGAYYEYLHRKEAKARKHYLLQYNSEEELNQNRYINPESYCVIDLAKDATIEKKGILYLGWKKFKESKLETRLCVGPSAKLNIEGNVQIGYGSDIEVFRGAKLTLGGNFASNIGTTIICANEITIGRDVKVGRNVTIRDNNGGHYINRHGYKDQRPVVIGDKVWLCEGCTIMPGVKIGDGAIIGAHSLVVSNVPAHTMVSGNPAQVVDEDVLWKY